MKKSKAEHSAFDTAIYYLTFKDRSSYELTNKLKEKGYSEEQILETMDKLSYYGYIDDEHYALSYIKSNCNHKGEKKIKMELSNKGIHRDIIEEQFAEVDFDEENAIDASFKKRFMDSDLQDEKQKNRIISYYMRRGYRFENIKKVVENYKNIQ